MRIAFWGTPEFATPTLRALLGEGFDVVAVITQPDRPVKRSRSTSLASPIKEIALAEGLPVLQPESARDAGFREQLAATKPDVSVVVAYGLILPQDLISLPPLGTFNVHASLLPKLRGAAPIQAAILEGLPETGISIMRMVRKLDAGPVVLMERTPIPSDETAGELQARLSELGAQALIEALALLSVDMLVEAEQDDSLATYAPKIDRSMAFIPWTADADAVARRIRAFDPTPGAFSRLGDQEVKLFGARAVGSATGEPGVVMGVEESGLIVGCGRGVVHVGDVHPSGRRRMSAREWASGRGIVAGDRFDPGPPPS